MMNLRWAGQVAWLFVFATLGLLAGPATAQVKGDYDGDGDVDGDDFWLWSGCMTGPAGESLDPNCAAFDFDEPFARNATVDMIDFVAFTQAFGVTKVPLGGSVTATADGARFKVYVPTQWGGVLTVATSAGTISDLQHPDGSAFQNGTETGENQHGWYTFRVTGSTSYNVSATFAQTGQAAKRPWNFYWWAIKGDYIREPWSGGNGVANTTALGTDEQVASPGSPVAPGADVVRCWEDGNLETSAAGDDYKETLYALYRRISAYRPLDKYDQLHGASARWWEALYHRGTERWEGHCRGGAVASILLNQPAKVAGKPYDADGEELEGLWSELADSDRADAYQYDDSISAIDPGPPIAGPDPSDGAVGRLHDMFEKWVRGAHHALYSNLRAEAGTDPSEVWNHAIYKFTATYSETPGGDERIVRVVNELAANQDLYFEPGYPTTGTQDREFTYTYVVKYLDIGQVQIPYAGQDFVGSTGAACFAPESLYHIIGTIWIANNGWVLEENVRADDASN